jgi:SARP family transcriptional regulator, regulator of embCAB operon
MLTRPNGYMIRVGRGELDLERFEGLVRKCRAALAADDPERAAEQLRDALELWRGPPQRGA